jgi:hypothetical protein
MHLHLPARRRRAHSFTFTFTFTSTWSALPRAPRRTRPARRASALTRWHGSLVRLRETHRKFKSLLVACRGSSLLPQLPSSQSSILQNPGRAIRNPGSLSDDLASAVNSPPRTRHHNLPLGCWLPAFLLLNNVSPRAPASKRRAHGLDLDNGDSAVYLRWEGDTWPVAATRGTLIQLMDPTAQPAAVAVRIGTDRPLQSQPYRTT